MSRLLSNFQESGRESRPPRLLSPLRGRAPLTRAPSPSPPVETVPCGAIRRRKIPFQKKTEIPKGRRGQVTVELILMMVVAAVLMQVSWTAIKSRGFLDDFARTPNQALGNMMANGNWIIIDDTSKNHHPNHYGKRYSLDPL